MTFKLVLLLKLRPKLSSEKNKKRFFTLSVVVLILDFFVANFCSNQQKLKSFVGKCFPNRLIVYRKGKRSIRLKAM